MRWAWIAVVLAGCSAVFGLEPVANGDGDNDGISDGVDNCAHAFNPDQSDLDRDGTGDACDACAQSDSPDVDNDMIPDACDGCIGNGIDEDGNGLSDNCEACVGIGPDTDHDGVADNCDRCAGGPEHDEDHDGLPDACDDCPHVANAMQEDADGDLVGDACDPEIDRSSIRFDAFTSQDPTWFVYGPGWVFSDDAYDVTVPSPKALRTRGTPSGTFAVSTMVSITSATADGSVGVFVVDSKGTLTSALDMACLVSSDGVVTLPGAPNVGTVIVEHPELPFELLLVYDAKTNVQTCRVTTASGIASVQAPGIQPIGTWQAGIGTTQCTARFENFALVGAAL